MRFHCLWLVALLLVTACPDDDPADPSVGDTSETSDTAGLDGGPEFDTRNADDGGAFDTGSADSMGADASNSDWGDASADSAQTQDMAGDDAIGDTLLSDSLGEDVPDETDTGSETMDTTSEDSRDLAQETDVGADMGCPDISCGVECPFGYWEEQNGCPSCACAPPDLFMARNATTNSLEFTTFEVEVSMFIGGIDRILFATTWDWDDPESTDDQETLLATVGLMQLGEETVPTTENRTFFFVTDGDTPLELRAANWTSYFFGTVSWDAYATGGYLSIRETLDGRLEGGLLLELEELDPADPEDPQRFRAGASFVEANPSDGG